MKISLIQTSPQTDKAENLRITRGLMEDAVRTDSPDLIVLPEYFEYYGGTPDEKLAAAESVPDGPAYKMAQDFAREHKVFVHAGTLMEKVPNEKRIYNSTFVFNREGKEIAHYRKIHMFDIVGPDGTAYKESATVKPGENVVVYDLDGFKIGCAICYDIRFAELYLELEKAGADVIVLPAAFTLQTGKDHWEVLARARAIETRPILPPAARPAARFRMASVVIPMVTRSSAIRGAMSCARVRWRRLRDGAHRARADRACAFAYSDGQPSPHRQAVASLRIGGVICIRSIPCRSRFLPVISSFYRGSRQPLSGTGVSSVSCTVPSSRSSRSAVWSALPSPSPYRGRIPPCFTT